MTLKDKIEQYKQQSAKKTSPAMAATMKQCTSDLAATMPSRNLPVAGTKLKSFSLPDSLGSNVSLDQLVANGPAIVTFFRGMW